MAFTVPTKHLITAGVWDANCYQSGFATFILVPAICCHLSTNILSAGWYLNTGYLATKGNRPQARHCISQPLLLCMKQGCEALLGSSFCWEQWLVQTFSIMIPSTLCAGCLYSHWHCKSSVCLVSQCWYTSICRCWYGVTVKSKLECEQGWCALGNDVLLWRLW